MDFLPIKEIEINCPICYNDLNHNENICIIDKCEHKICFNCFDIFKKHSNKCPICGLEFISVLNKKIKEDEKIEEIIFLNEKDYEEIKQNKNDLLGS
jgi:hypothetical protein